MGNYFYKNIIKLKRLIWIQTSSQLSHWSQQFPLKTLQSLLTVTLSMVLIGIWTTLVAVTQTSLLSTWSHLIELQLNSNIWFTIKMRINFRNFIRIRFFQPLNGPEILLDLLLIPTMEEAAFNQTLRIQFSTLLIIMRLTMLFSMQALSTQSMERGMILKFSLFT